jgi:hypothetical protein
MSSPFRDNTICSASVLFLHCGLRQTGFFGKDTLPHVFHIVPIRRGHSKPDRETLGHRNLLFLHVRRS